MRSKAPQRGTHYRSSKYADTLGRIASNVRRLRESLGWTQEEVAARAASLSPRLYRQIESARGNVTAATLTRLAEALGVDIAALLVPAPTPTPRPRGRPSKGLDVRAVGAESSSSQATLDVQALVNTEEGSAVDPWIRFRNLAEELRVEAERLARMLPRDASAAAPTAPHAQESPVQASSTSSPSVPPDASLRDVLAALLFANPRGMLTSEMTDAVTALGRKLRKNELHALVSALYEAGHLTREGRRGSFRYQLRKGRDGELPRS